MNSGNEILISTLLSSKTLIVFVALILSTIMVLKKGKQFNKFARVVMIALLIIFSGIAVFLVFLAFAFGNSHPPILPILLQ